MKNSFKIIKQKYTRIGAFSLVIVATLSFFIGAHLESKKYSNFLMSFVNLREKSDKYNFINPLIGVVSAPATDVGIYSDIKSDILAYLDEEEKNGNLFEYSFYFRDMNTGFWFGDYENFSLFPASLFKLPVAIAVYKQGEDDQSFLTRNITYTQEISELNTTKQLNAESLLIVGQSYSVDILVDRMLTDSDNGAKNLLLSSLDKKYLEQLLDIVTFSGTDKKQTYEISSRKYANFLRILYSSSYLNEEHSERILKILSKTSFKDGIVSGLPRGTLVAHKFGVYEFYEKVKGVDTVAIQLHDCGIVYHASEPYTLCLLTKGKDEASLFKVISTVSRMIYTHQESEQIKRTN